MPKLPGTDLESGSIFRIVIFAIILVYLWGTFTTSGTGICTKKDIEDERFDCASIGQSYDKIDFVLPETEKLQSSTLWIVKLLLISFLVYLAYSIESKFIGRNPSRRDLATVIIVIAGVYLAWVYIIEPTNLFGATSFGQLRLDNIGQKTAQMLGMS